MDACDRLLCVAEKVVAEKQGIKPLVILLNATESKVCEQAACSIKRLALSNSDTQKQITKHGAVEPLIALLDSGQDDRVQEYAAAALAELASIIMGKTAIERGGGVQPLVALLSDSQRYPNSKQYAAAALARLSIETNQKRQSRRGERNVDTEAAGLIKKKTQAEVIAEAGAIVPLVKLCSGDRGSEAQEESAGALWALAVDPANRIAITEAGGIGPLVELLGCTNAKAREHAEAALVRLSIEGSNRVLIIEQLVSMLADERGTAAQEQAAAALANLAKESSDNRASILNANGIPRLLNLLHSTSIKAKEMASSAISQLAHQNFQNQSAIAEAEGIPKIVGTLLTASANVKEISNVNLCTLTAQCIWNLSEDNRANQTALMKEGCIPPIVGMVTNPDPEMQTNAAGALAAISRDNPEVQAAVARCGAIPPLCTLVRDGTPETKEESAAALWSLATDNAPNKATIAKLGGIEPLVNMLMFGHSEKSSMNAAGALASLAAQHADNRLTITKRMVTVLGGKAPAPRAVRLLSALASLCDNEPTNQVAIAKSGGVQHLIVWLTNPSEDVQVQAARAMLAVSSNNSTTQLLIGKIGGVPPLVGLVRDGMLEAKEHSACALWHLATLSENRVLIKESSGIPPIVAMLVIDAQTRVDGTPCHAVQLATMLLLRLAEGSTRAALAIADASGITPLVRLLANGNPPTQQMAAAALAAIARISQTRNKIANAGAIVPLVKLITSTTLGTPETAARALSYLARDDVEDDEISLGEGGNEEEAGEGAVADGDGAKSADISDGVGADLLEADVSVSTGMISDGAGRRLCIKESGGVRQIILMLDGSNLPGSEVLKPGAIGGWAAARIGVVGALETASLFPGSQADFGIRVGMQEQAAATLADIANGDEMLQLAIIEAAGLSPLLSLVQNGSSLAQEHAARTIWYLSTSIDNQHTLVMHTTIVDLVTLVKSGSHVAQEMAAAGLSELASGYIIERKSILDGLPAPSLSTSAPSPAIPAMTTPENEHSSLMQAATQTERDASPLRAATDAEEAGVDAPAGGSSGVPSTTALIAAAMGEPDRLLAISEAGGIPPLVKLSEVGSPGGREMATSALWHLALDSENQASIAANGGIKPIVTLLAEGNDAALEHASNALKRLATDNPENQAQIAKRLVGLLDHDDPMVVSRAAHDLQALAHDHPGAPVVIVNAGAISPLVTVLSNGKTDEGRNEAAKTLQTLANSGPANQLAIAVGLVALLGVGTDQAQEYVTALLLELSSGLESNLHNRRAIANAGPFKMLVQQLRSESAKVKMLAAAVMANLSGDSEENVAQIAAANGVKPLVALLNAEDGETQAHSAAVLADMAKRSQEHADIIQKEGAIPFLVRLLQEGQGVEVMGVAADVLGSIAVSYAVEVGESGAILPLVELLKSDSVNAQKKAACAIANVAGGGQKNQDDVETAGGIELLVSLLGECDENQDNVGANWEVQARSAEALAELTKANTHNQQASALCGAIDLLICLLLESNRDEPKEQAANALWRLSWKNLENQEAVAEAGGIAALVDMVGQTTEKGQEMAASALAGLALDHEDNQTYIAALLNELLESSRATDSTREKAARALARFAAADSHNQDALAEAGGVELIVSLMEPRKYERLPGGSTAVHAAKENDEEAADDTVIEATSEHHMIQKELAAALWSISDKNTATQARIARVSAIPLLIALLADHPDIHRDAAGALWSLADDSNNQKLIAGENGIPPIVELLRTPSGLTPRRAALRGRAQETAAGALHSLAARGENRTIIADVGGITLLIPLFDGGTDMAKIETEGALLTLAIDHPSNQYIIASKLVNMLAAGPSDASEATNAAAISRLEANEWAVKVIYKLTLNRDNKDALSRTPAISQLVRQLKGGSEECQKLSSDALTQIARMSGELRIQVTQQLVTLLRNPNPDVRQRAGFVLRDMNEGNGEDSKHQKEAAMAGGVGPLVELLRDGLKNERVEAQEYALWSLSMAADAKRAGLMVREGLVAPLIQSLNGAQLGVNAQEYGAFVLSCLALDRNAHGEIVEKGGIAPLVALLAASTLGAKKHAAVGLARLALGNPESQASIAEAGALVPLVAWLKIFTGTSTDSDASSPEELHTDGDTKRGASRTARISREPAASRELAPVAALALGDLARDNSELQARISNEGALRPLIVMLTNFGEAEAQKSACSALATLAQGHKENQMTIASAGGIGPLVELLKSDRRASHENASRAIAMLSSDDTNKQEIAATGGIEPLVGLLSTGNDATQHHAAEALECLGKDCPDNQISLAGCNASVPLVALLSSDSDTTAEAAMRALLCMAEHQMSQKVVIKRLVEVLNGRSTSAQLKAAGTLAVLSSRSSVNRSLMVKAGAIEPLVGLLGNGQRADIGTPPERAAAVLGDLARLAESKVEIGRAGGIGPLVRMLSSSCKESQAHAVGALFHLSTTADNKTAITTTGGINFLVAFLSSEGTSDRESQRHAAGALWQLATSADNKNAIVEAGGISPLARLLSLQESEESSQPAQPASAPTPRRRSQTATNESSLMLLKEAAAALLSELARSQSAFRIAIVQAGCLLPLIDLVHGDSGGAQKQATCALWGLASEPKFRRRIASVPRAVERVVELLRKQEGETQGFAAATLLCLAADEFGKQAIMSVGGAGPLMSIALGSDSWLRTQCVQTLKLLGYPDPQKKRAGDNPSPQLSPRMRKFQEKLAAHPDIWMVQDDHQQKGQLIVNNEHMADLACKISVGQRVIVDPGQRAAEVMFIGKIAEIAPGYWVGVYYDEPVGKNDGSIKGRRCFECPHDFGGFLRPDHIRNDPNPPLPRQHNVPRKQIEGEEQEETTATEETQSAARSKGGSKRHIDASKGEETAEVRSARSGTSHTKTSVSSSSPSTGEVDSAEKPTRDAHTSTDATVAITPEQSHTVPALGAATPRSVNAQGRRQRRQTPKREAVSDPGRCNSENTTSTLGETGSPPVGFMFRKRGGQHHVCTFDISSRGGCEQNAHCTSEAPCAK